MTHTGEADGHLYLSNCEGVTHVIFPILGSQKQIIPTKGSMVKFMGSKITIKT